MEKDDWEINAEKKRKVEEQEKAGRERREQEAWTVEEGLSTGGAAWDSSVKGGAKKRNQEPQTKVKRNKKRKLEKLVGWGEEGDEQEDSNIRRWLMGEEYPDIQTVRIGEQTGHYYPDSPCIKSSCAPEAGPGK